jgi:uncharacterized damage-inducible protein DinB
MFATREVPMTETARIAQQLRWAFDGDTWTGVSVGEAVRKFTAERAARPPALGVNTPWQILLHIGCWIEVARVRLSGRASSPTAEQNFPTIADSSEEAWREAWAGVERSYQALAAEIEAFPDDRLAETAPAKDYPYYHLLHGVIQHSLYHAGQLALLARA